MNICNAPLAYSFAKSPLELWTAYACGLAGIWGWGLGLELLRKDRFQIPTFFHAFLEGTVVCSFAMLFLSVLGFWQVAWPLTITGWGIGGFALFLGMRRSSDFSAKLEHIQIWEWILLLAVALPTAFRIISAPVLHGDTTSIWGYHAKALTCGPLFQTAFANEKIWAGTHPEYPLFLSYLYALFFSLSDSFRDDWFKVWQSVSLISAVVVAYLTLSHSLGRRLHAFSALTAFMAAGSGVLADGPVELHSAIFVWMAALALFAGDDRRVSVYLLGFLFCKNEGLAGSVLLVALMAAYSIYQKKNIRELSHLIPWGVITGLWILVMSQLPSNHEQYPSHLISLEAWKNGFSRIPAILEGCANTLWGDRVWRLTFLILPLSAVILCLKRIRESRMYPSIGLSFLWATGMLGVFLAVYIVSPWGSDLYRITFERLFAQLFPAFSLCFVALLAILTQDERKKLRIIGFTLQILVMTYYGVSVKNNSIGSLEKYVQRARAGQTGLSAFYQNREWAQALSWDKEIPAASKGALLNSRSYYFGPNYLLFPRVLYPAAPHIVAGTTSFWKAWESFEQIPWKELKLRFVIDDRIEKVFLVD